jgi:hypothetical protein
MAGIVIGDDAIPISEIVAELLKPPMDAILIENWTNLANALHLPYALIKVLKHNLTLEKVNYSDIVNELLHHWLSRTGKTATVGKLLSIIKQNFDWKGVEGMPHILFNFHLI